MKKYIKSNTIQNELKPYVVLRGEFNNNYVVEVKDIPENFFLGATLSGGYTLYRLSDIIAQYDTKEEACQDPTLI